MPPRIGVNIRPALLYAVSVSQNILRTPNPPYLPQEVLEMLMVMGLRYANSELQIQYMALLQIPQEDREQIMLQANLR